MLGKHSGRHALRQAFADLGYTIEGDELNRVFERFKEIADRKQRISSLDLEAIASRLAARPRGRSSPRVAGHHDQDRRPRTRRVTCPNAREETTRPGRGRRAGGRRLPGHRPRDGRPAALAEYTIGAVSGGARRARRGARRVVDRRAHVLGPAVSTDIIEASAEAYLRAMLRTPTATEPEQVPAGV